LYTVYFTLTLRFYAFAREFAIILFTLKARNSITFNLFTIMSDIYSRITKYVTIIIIII